MNVLVTGAAGFIGSNLCDRLLDRGDTVVGLDNFVETYPAAIKRAHSRRLAEEGALIEGDVLDGALVGRLLREHPFDVVVHLAALPGVRPSVERPWDYARVNVEGTAVLAHHLAERGGPRLVFASSSSVYGRVRELPYRESHRVDLPASPYAASKRSAELMLEALHHVHGLGVTCLRYFTVYGPRQRPEMAIHRFCRAVDAGEPIPMFGDGSSSRDYTYVDDIVAGTIAAVERADDRFRIYNLGDQRPVTLRALVDHIGEALGKVPRIEPHPAQPGDVEHTLASIELARAELGYTPQVSLEEGLERFVAWLRRPQG